MAAKICRHFLLLTSNGLWAMEANAAALMYNRQKNSICPDLNPVRHGMDDSVARLDFIQMLLQKKAPA